VGTGLRDLERGRPDQEGHLRALPRRPEVLAELLIDCEEDKALRALLVGMLAEMERK
jgi:hypothetical protein